MRKFKLLTAKFVNEGNLEGNYLVKGRCSFEYQLGDGWASEGEKSVYETILQIDGDTIVVSHVLIVFIIQVFYVMN